MSNNINSFPSKNPLAEIFSSIDNGEITSNQESIFWGIFNASPTGLVLVDKSNYIRHINKTWKDCMCIDEMYSVGKRFGDGFRCIESLTNGCGNGEHCIICNINNTVTQVLETGIPSYDIILRNEFIVNDSGISPWYKATFIPVFYDGEKSVLIAADDIMKLQPQI